MKTVIKILLATFLVICVGVHVAGFFVHVSDETPLSHTIHLLSYALCLFVFLKRVKYHLVLYGIGFVYPFVYHALCLEKTYVELHKVNPVCMLVVILLPAIGIWMWLEAKAPKK
jgi:hypothetical protein